MLFSTVGWSSQVPLQATLQSDQQTASFITLPTILNSLTYFTFKVETVDIGIVQSLSLSFFGSSAKKWVSKIVDLKVIQFTNETSPIGFASEAFDLPQGGPCYITWTGPFLEIPLGRLDPGPSEPCTSAFFKCAATSCTRNLPSPSPPTPNFGSPQPTATIEDEESDKNSDGSSFPVEAVSIGIAVPVGVLLIAGALVALYFIRRKNRQKDLSFSFSEEKIEDKRN